MGKLVCLPWYLGACVLGCVLLLVVCGVMSLVVLFDLFIDLLFCFVVCCLLLGLFSVIC